MTTYNPSWRGGIPLKGRTALQDLIARIFSPTFSKSFSAVFATPAGLKRYTVTLRPAAAAGIDTYLRRELPNTNYATAVNMPLYTITHATNAYSILIKWDLSSIPAGAKIVSATQSLFNILQIPANQVINIYAILAANSGWTEAGATWNHAVHDTVHWAGDVAQDGGADAGCTVSGTDHNSTAIGTITCTSGTAAGTEHQSSLNVAQFQSLLTANYGFVIYFSNAANGSVYYFGSSDNTTEAYRPKLVVVYDK